MLLFCFPSGLALDDRDLFAGLDLGIQHDQLLEERAGHRARDVDDRLVGLDAQQRLVGRDRAADLDQPLDDVELVDRLAHAGVSLGAAPWLALRPDVLEHVRVDRVRQRLDLADDGASSRSPTAVSRAVRSASVAPTGEHRLPRQLHRVAPLPVLELALRAVRRGVGARVPANR